MIRKTQGTLNKVNIGTKLEVFDGSHMAHWPEQRQQLRVLPTREPGSPLTTPPQPAGSLAHKWAANAGTCPKRATISAACQYFLQCSINTTAAISKPTCDRELQAFIPEHQVFCPLKAILLEPGNLITLPFWTNTITTTKSNIWGRQGSHELTSPFKFSPISPKKMLGKKCILTVSILKSSQCSWG